MASHEGRRLEGSRAGAATLICSFHERFERIALLFFHGESHAALWAFARLRLDNFRVHRTGVRGGGGSSLRRGRRIVPAQVFVALVLATDHASEQNPAEKRKPN